MVDGQSRQTASRDEETAACEPSLELGVTPSASQLKSNVGWPSELTFGWFLFANALGLLAFPFVCIAAIVVFWSREEVFGVTLCMYAMVQMLVLWVGIVHFRHASRLVVPAVVATIALFVYNRHWTGQPNDSPFSNGIGTVSQQAYGFCAYYRVFDEPYSEFGRTYTDWAALAGNVEVAVAIAIVIATVSWYLSLGQSFDSPKMQTSDDSA